MKLSSIAGFTTKAWFLWYPPMERKQYIFLSHITHVSATTYRQSVSLLFTLSGWERTLPLPTLTLHRSTVPSLFRNLLLIAISIIVIKQKHNENMIKWILPAFLWASKVALKKYFNITSIISTEKCKDTKSTKTSHKFFLQNIPK